MPAHTAIEAARITYGTPPNNEAVCKMTDWLDANCRDWRYESGVLQGALTGGYSPIVVSCVFEESVEQKKLQMRISQQVRRWGFQRARNSAELYVPISIDAYADGPLGHKMKVQMQMIMVDIANRKQAQKEQREAERQKRVEALVKKRNIALLRETFQRMRENVGEAQRLADEAIEQDSKRRRTEEAQE